MAAQALMPSTTVATPSSATTSPDAPLASTLTPPGMTPEMTAAAHASPASQMAPALLNLTTSSTGTQRMTLRLEPEELGTVQVRIDRPADAPAHVDISVSRPETLTLMLRDQTQLQHTLDQAGVPAEGRTISVHLTGQDADRLSRQGGGSGNPGTYDQTPRYGSRARNATDPDGDTSLSSPTPMRWQRVGLDITA
jgi:flagellar hook-length control protein FliK